MSSPIGNYTQLVAEIGNWLNRADLASEIPVFIRLTEAQIERTTRTWQMVTRAYAPLTPGEYTPLPGDYLELVRARIINAQTPQKPLEYASMGEIDNIQARNPSPQIPTSYNITGNALRLGPVPDATYDLEVLYYSKIPKLSASIGTNWLLADHPDIYLYGALSQASKYLKNDERVPMWKDGFDTAISDLRIANAQGEKGGQPLRARFTPYGGRRRT